MDQDQGYGRMRPMFEAMSVCSYTIEWLDRQEREHSEWDLHTNLGNLGRALQEFIDASVAGKIPGNRSKEVLAFSVFCLSTVNRMTSVITKRLRAEAPQFCDRPREPIVFLLGQLDSLTNRIDEIAEAWEFSLDDELSAKISEAIRQIDPAREEIPEWREALELV